MPFAVKRAYDEARDADGVRVLVDRLWPRGIRKESARIDLWPKDLAPSTELRKWIHADPSRWDEFKAKYFEELHAPEKQEGLDDLRAKAREDMVTLVFSARDRERNNALVLLEFLEHETGA